MKTVHDFFRTADGGRVRLYSLRNRAGFGADICDWGGAVVNLVVPDRNGNPVDVALGWRNPTDYHLNPGCMGALIGRVANRIGGGRFTFDGQVYQLALNDGNGRNSLHGSFGYHQRLWRAELRSNTELALKLVSPHGDAGFPGRLDIEVVYRFTENNALEIEYHAVADRPTVFNPTNHLYFNLNGEETGDCADHLIAMTAEKRTPVDEFFVPTGAVEPVEGTPCDLRNGRTFAAIRADLPRGCDGNYCLEKGWNENFAAVYAPGSGIVLSVSTSAPGVQFYMAGSLKAGSPGKGTDYGPFAGFCLETQLWPDAVNHPDFPSCRIEPGEPFRSKSVYAFTAR